MCKKVKMAKIMSFTLYILSNKRIICNRYAAYFKYKTVKNFSFYYRTRTYISNYDNYNNTNIYKVYIMVE